MKNTLLTLTTLFLLLVSKTINAQCPTAPVVSFNSQQEVNDFLTNYPNCTQLPNNIEIGVSSTFQDINNLSPFDQITSIGGDLTIYNNDALTSLTGLENLTSIGGGLFIQDNEEVINLNPLQNLTSIGGALSIADNPNLADLSALSSITSLGGFLSIINNDALTNLNGLENLTAIGGLLWVTDNALLNSIAALENIDYTTINNLKIENNPQLDACDFTSICNYLGTGGVVAIANNKYGCNNIGDVNYACSSDCPTTNIQFTNQQQINDFAANYPNCTEITGNVEIGFIFSSSNITDLSPLSQITSIGGYLEMVKNDNLPNLTGLDNLTHIGDFLKISYNDGLFNNITALGNLISIGGYLEIVGNSSLMNLSGLEGITTMNGYVYIRDNNSLSNLTGLNNITNMNSYLYIRDNNVLSDFTGLASLTTVDGNVDFDGNANVDFNGLQNLTSIGGNLGILYNSVLQDLSGLDNLISIGGKLSILFNPQLIDLIGLEGLLTIGEDLRIYINGNLTKINGLRNLTSINGELRIDRNFKLFNILTGLQSLDYTGITYLSIYQNQLLSLCNATPICNYLATGGAANISINANGCNIQAQVETSCPSSCFLFPPIITANDQPIPDGVYQASNEVNSIGTVPVGGNVNFKAAQTILLDNNFTVEPNADFSAEIDDCGGQ